jgi:O-antigen/teichoic acid export membrane protein
LVELVTASIALVLGIYLIAKLLLPIEKQAVCPGKNCPPKLSILAEFRTRFRDCCGFMWIRLSTKLFSDAPIFIIGKVLGDELVGLVGVARKIIEISGVPYLIIGNALMVRIVEISKKGSFALKPVWDTSTRIASTAFPFFSVMYLSSDYLSNVFFSRNYSSIHEFQWALFIFIPYIFSCVLTPLSDYLGGIVKRSMILPVVAILQIFIIWIAAHFWGNRGAILSMVICYFLIVILYSAITAKLLINSLIPRVQKDVGYFILFSLLSLAFCEFVASPILSGVINAGIYKAIMLITLYVIILMSIIFYFKNILRVYFNSGFFEIGKSEAVTH